MRGPCFILGLLLLATAGMALSRAPRVLLCWRPSTTPGVLYEVWSAPAADRAFLPLATNVSGTNYTIRAARAQAFYRVRARDSYGLVSDWATTQ